MSSFHTAVAMVIASVLSTTALGCGPKDTKVVAPEPVIEVDAAPVVAAGIRFDIEPGDAEVIVDGEPLGSASYIVDTGALELEPGLHQILIRHDDYETYRVEVTIGDTVEVMRISLQAKEP